MSSDRFTVTLTPADIGVFQREYCGRLSRVWRGYVWGLLIWAAVMVVVLGSWWLVEWLVPDVPVEFIWPGLFVVAIFSARWLQPLLLRFSAIDLSSLTRETRFEVRTDGLFTQTIDYDNLTRWQAFKDFLLTPRAAYLGLGANRAIIVPRSAFADAAAFDSFVTAFRANTGL